MNLRTSTITDQQLTVTKLQIPIVNYYTEYFHLRTKRSTKNTTQLKNKLDHITITKNDKVVSINVVHVFKNTKVL